MSDTAPEHAGRTIPSGARLLHVGLPKTGTTALQQATARNRAALLEAGVRYPGTAINHRVEFAAFLGRRRIWTARGPERPRRRAWSALRAEIDADAGRRVFLSHEVAATCTDEQAASFRAELGPQLHVAVTVRNYGELLCSRWQQYVKSGLALPFDEWLGAVLAETPDPQLTPMFHVTSAQADVVERWCRVLGPDRVTVVVSDRSRPDQIAHAFGTLLGVPAELLAHDGGGKSSNRSLSVPEAELIRGLNEVARTDPDLWSRHQDLVRSGAITRLQSARRPRADEPRLRLPAWAVPLAARTGRDHADRIAATGCQVIGDLSRLHDRAEDAGAEAGDHIPLDAAVEAMVGLMTAGVRPPPPRAKGRVLRTPGVHHRQPFLRRLGRDCRRRHLRLTRALSRRLASSRRP